MIVRLSSYSRLHLRDTHPLAHPYHRKARRWRVQIALSRVPEHATGLLGNPEGEEDAEGAFNYLLHSHFDDSNRPGNTNTI